ncbi:hypothetical protein B0H17DRAFT_454635 [Mycena rosella]|uniref:SET domain-containing protein n=1 Tax=Mycena rosella TaxID=1033263 RepID=A0AAD7GZ54_MYCRO|nr:hypothetical protein B0H17DRAFT_454635 [Mycena rosella]
MTPLFFTYCDCGGDKKGDKEGECGSLECGCQDAAEALGSAYTNGLFNFTYGPDQVVVECNPYCHCSPNCPNRVAQSGRQVPIEIFKTARCGWGVRAPVDVERGTVLGMYTGSLIPRAEAMDLTGEAKEYCFDLDYNQEHEDEEDLTEKYTVDSLRYGNWTRFINHSCEPNLRVQPIVYDTLPSQNMAYLTFIAMERIPARTELTFDYDPAVQRDHKVTQGQQRKGWKRKSESERPESATDCVCGADPERCRGWVRTK